MLSIVDARTLAVVARMPLGEDPHEVVVGPDDRTAYVSQLGDGRLRTIARVDLVGRRTLTPLNVAPLEGVHGLAVEGGKLWVSAVGSKAVGVVDLAAGRVTHVLGTGQENSHMLWLSRDGRRLLVANAGSGTMSLFTLTEPRVNTGAATAYAGTADVPDWKGKLLEVGQKAEGFAVSPDEREAWVGNDDGSISVLDLVAGVVAARFDAGTRGANRVRFTPDGARVVVTLHTGKDLVVLDAKTRTVVKRVPIEERGASGIAMQPDGKRVFIACPRDHFVAVVDLEKLERVATVDVGREPDGIVWWDGGR